MSAIAGRSAPAERDAWSVRRSLEVARASESDQLCRALARSGARGPGARASRAPPSGTSPRAPALGPRAGQDRARAAAAPGCGRSASRRRRRPERREGDRAARRWLPRTATARSGRRASRAPARCARASRVSDAPSSRARGPARVDARACVGRSCSPLDVRAPRAGAHGRARRTSSSTSRGAAGRGVASRHRDDSRPRAADCTERRGTDGGHTGQRPPPRGELRGSWRGAKRRAPRTPPGGADSAPASD